MPAGIEVIGEPKTIAFVNALPLPAGKAYVFMASDDSNRTYVRDAGGTYRLENQTGAKWYPNLAFMPGVDEYWTNGAHQNASFSILANVQYFFYFRHGTGNTSQNSLETIGFQNNSGGPRTGTVALYDVDPALWTLGNVLEQDEVSAASGEPWIMSGLSRTLVYGRIYGYALTTATASTSLRSATVCPTYPLISAGNANPFFYYSRAEAYSANNFANNPVVNLANASSAPLLLTKFN